MPIFRFAMGLDRRTRTTLVARCCYGAFFGFGFVLTVLTFAAMFWVAWCYFGLTIVQVSDAQRRAIVNYSHTTSKPFSTPTTALPSRSTTLATEETSINSISKLPTTESVLRGSSRGESQVKINKKKEAAIISSLAKGDFAARDRATNNNNATALPPKDASDSTVSPQRGPPRIKEELRPGSEEKASILTASSVESSEEDRVYARRVFPPGTENRPEEKSESGDRSNRRSPSDAEPNSRLDISPTKAYDADIKSESSRVAEPPDRPPRDEVRTPSREYIDRDRSEVPRRDDIQSSRRSEPETVYREPDFDREYPRRYATSSDQGRSRFDDFDDERGSRGRYDKRDRGRESDDRYSKGDTRVYPDERGLSVNPPADEERYRARERQPDDIPKRGDDDKYDDRYRDYDKRSRNRDRDTRYKDRDMEDRSPLRDDRYRDDERYKPRDDDKYIDRDEERNRPRDDERYRPREDDRYRSRDDDRTRPRDDDKYVYRDDDRYRYRDDDRYRVRGDDRYRTRDDDRYRSDREPEDRKDTPLRSRDEKDEYRPRVDDAKYVDSATSRLRDTDVRESVSRSSSSLPIDRKTISSRSEYDIRVEESVTDYDNPARDRPRSRVRDDVTPTRLSRPSYEEERYRDRDRDDGYRRPSRYDDEVRDILPTKTRDDNSYSRSSLIDSRPRDVSDSRYVDNERDRSRDDRYEQDGRIRSTRIQDSRSSAPTSENSRRYTDDDDRYRTRLPNERTIDPKNKDRREEVVLDRRSYPSEEDEEYRRRGSKTDAMYEDRDRKPLDDTRRRYRDDESYSRRDPIDDEDYTRSRGREDYERDRSRSRDRYDDEYRRYDDKYSSKGDKSSPPLPVRTYPDDDERPRRRDSEISTMRKEDPRDREEILRPSSSSRNEERSYIRDEYSDSKSSSRRRYDDDLSLSDSRDQRDDYIDDRRNSRGSRQPANTKEPTLGSSRSSVNSREPTDIVIREKRFQSSDNKHQSSRVYGDDASSDRSYTDIESKPREQVRPLSAKDVIEAAIRHSDRSDQNSRKVYYPVFDPRVSNLTSPEIIRPSERRGTTITAKKRRSVWRK